MRGLRASRAAAGARPCPGSARPAARPRRRGAARASSASRSPSWIRLSGSSGSKPSRNRGLAVDRQRTGRQAVEGVVAVHDARAAGGVARELQRRLDGLGAAVAEVDPVQVRGAGEQLLGEQAGQQRGVELRPGRRVRRRARGAARGARPGGCGRGRRRRSRRAGRDSPGRPRRTGKSPRLSCTCGRIRSRAASWAAAD